jgi:hypothetical protein
MDSRGVKPIYEPPRTYRLPQLNCPVECKAGTSPYLGCYFGHIPQPPGGVCVYGHQHEYGEK